MMTSRTFRSVELITFPTPGCDSTATGNPVQFERANDAFEVEALLLPEGGFLRGLAFALAMEGAAALAFLSIWHAVRMML
jgi:hypothetical protein